MGDVAIWTPPAHDAQYLPTLLRTVEEHRVGLLVPTIDPELPILADARASFLARGCHIVVSSPGFVNVALDKLTTYRVFAAAGIAVPRTWVPPLGLMDDLPAEVFVKPRSGSASIDTYCIPLERLASVMTLIEEPLIQEVLHGDEITIDALLDFHGRPVHYVPRKRIRTIGGESVQGVTLTRDTKLSTWIERVLRVSGSLGAAGPLTVQAFLTSHGPVLTEINARFGGGFPLSLQAGADYPSWLMDMASGLPVDTRFGDYEAGLFMTRHHVERFVRQPAW
jgi:carbamoyl-phosphate synthase large subunit